MKFSIITTFYNNDIEEVELIKNSILNQTYTKWEWIISDDFSKLSTIHIELLKSLPKLDKRIKYVEQKFKKEMFWNPQVYASGDIIMNVNSDDTILPKTLEIFNYHFIKHPEAILITSEANIFNPNITASTFLEYTKFNNVYDKHTYFPLGWLNMGVPLTWRNINVNFNKEFDIDNRSVINDYLIHTKLEEIGKFLHLPRVFYNCKIRDNSASRMIDNDNNYNIHDFEKVNDIIKLRRNNKECNSALDHYNDIIHESISFYYSDINNEKTCQDISFITTNDLNYSKKNKIKELYIDHNLYFNEINNDIDYYIFYLNVDSNLEKFLEVYNSIGDSHKQITICSYDNINLYNEVKNSISNFNWLIYDNIYVITKNNV